MKFLSRSLVKRFFPSKQPRNISDQIKWDEFIQLPSKYTKNTKIISNRQELLALLPPKSICAELGVAYGVFSQKILKIVRPRELHLIDCVIPQDLTDLLTRLHDKRIQLHKGDSVEIMSCFPDHYFDWVYIDTSHDYEQTKKELAVARRKVKKNGLICGYDYIRFCYVLSTFYGVIDAVNEFCIKYDWEIRYLTNESGCYNSFCLKKRGSKT